MNTWTKDSALKELKDLINSIARIANAGRGSAEHTRWAMRTLQLLEEVFGASSMYYGTFAALPWCRTGTVVIQSFNIQREKDRLDDEAFLQQLETAKGLLEAAHDQLQRREINEVYEGKNTPRESSALVKVMNLTERKLRKIIRKPPATEREVQDAFENLLIGADIPHSRETESIEYSSKTYIPDFTLKQIDLAIEIKLCSRDGREKEIIGEINDDILAYKTKFGNLLFVIYDVGQIRDDDRFAREFEKDDDIVVRVVKH